MKKRGRPITKIDRVKIGLSISIEANKILNELANSGRTKSLVCECALKLFKETLDKIDKSDITNGNELVPKGIAIYVLSKS